RVIVDLVLKTGREMDLGGLDLWEFPEEVLRQRRGAVLYRAGHAELLARDDRQLAERIEIDGDLGDRAVRERYAAVRGAGLDADLADAFRAGGDLVEVLAVAAHVRAQLLDGAVLAADLADLAADRNLDAGRRVLVDVGGELGCDATVLLLLGVDRRPLEHDERRAVDVDVQEAGRERLLDQCPQRGELLLPVAFVERR